MHHTLNTGKGSLILQPAMVHQLGKHGKRWLIRSFLFHCTLASLQQLAGFINGLY